MFDVLDGFSTADVEPACSHRFLKPVAVFGFIDHIGVGTDHFDVVLFKNTIFVQSKSEIQRGLPAERRQQDTGTLFLDDLFDDLPLKRLYISAFRDFGVGHDRRRIGVHQYDFVAFFAKSFTGLSSGIVKFTGLANDDWPGSDQQDLLDIVATWHSNGPVGLERRKCAFSLGKIKFPKGTSRPWHLSMGGFR